MTVFPGKTQNGPKSLPLGVASEKTGTVLRHPHPPVKLCAVVWGRRADKASC